MRDMMEVTTNPNPKNPLGRMPIDNNFYVGPVPVVRHKLPKYFGALPPVSSNKSEERERERERTQPTMHATLSFLGSGGMVEIG